eukprot:5982352-Amphidinium_carterae.1
MDTGMELSVPHSRFGVPSTQQYRNILKLSRRKVSSGHFLSGVYQHGMTLKVAGNRGPHFKSPKST